MTVYADILFLVNFSMDFLSLYLTARIRSSPLQKGRLTAAALVGSAGGSIWMLVFPDGAGIWTIPAGFLLSVLMARIAFGKTVSPAELIRASLAVWGSGVILGGLMTLILSAGEPVLTTDAGQGEAFVPVFLICFAAAGFLVRLLSHASAKKSAEVCVEIAGECGKLDALCDSGSFVSDPLSGLPVIIVRSGIFPVTEQAMQALSKELRLRMIPVKGVGSERLLSGLIPDRVSVDGKEKNAVIAFSGDTAGFAGKDAILPAVLCR